jgi:CheY-like chemotaxis protein
MELPKRPRVIALTANASAADQESCRIAGMDAFLSKPLVLADFRQQLCVSCLSRFESKACSEP